MKDHGEGFRRAIGVMVTSMASMAAAGCDSSAPPAPGVVTRPKASETQRPRMDVVSEPADESDPQVAVDPMTVMDIDEANASRPTDSPGGRSDASPAARSESSFRVLTDPRPLYKPQVVLSQSHRDTCLVNVGDVFPELELTDVAGASRDWRGILGPKLTIVVLWSSQYVYAVEQVNRLEIEAVDVFEGAGVQVVAVNVGDAPEALAEWTQSGEGSIVHLADPTPEAFAKIATSRFPRTYVLDANGRIVWLDLEYSQSTRRDLENAVRYYLKHPPSRASI